MLRSESYVEDTDMCTMWILLSVAGVQLVKLA